MAIVLDVFAGEIVNRLAEFVEERAVTVLGVKDELKRLQRRMERIKHVLQDAERKRIQSEAVAGWVRELKDVIYDADDIIDLCRYEGGKLLDDQPSTSSDPASVRCSFPSLFSCFTSIRFRHEIGDRIKELSKRLDEISKDSSDLTFVQDEPDVRVTRVDPRQTSSVVRPSDIVGSDIERATKELVERMVSEDENRFQVFAVTGMGGIGKTTLAQSIFNHPRIQSEFPTKIWVCISQNFSDINLLKEIIRGSGENHGDLQTRAELLPLLKSAVSEKRFFLVLDDVWRADVWTSLLRSPLQNEAIKSRVLVTTRDRNVAMQIGAVHVHQVEYLPLESGWRLLCKDVFVTGEEEEMRSLTEVGIQIVAKCNGLPLAIKTIAGVLSTKERNHEEWNKVLRKEAWSMDKLPDDLRGALYLSYEDLPSYLKQCFLYCSLFPEDFKFSREDLVLYWAVEGFAEAPNDLFLESSYEYLEELTRRNLIEKDGEVYKMHDLLRSLAQLLSKDESFCGEAHELSTMAATRKLRRLRITDEGELAIIPEPLLLQKCLRTLFIRGCTSISSDIFVRFPFLRFLSLSDSGIENVPDAVGNLMHLRLLDLDRTRICSLPESTGCLTNLQVLKLSQCESLVALPKGITRLCNLRVLELDETPLDFIPAGMGRLVKLNIFTGFVVGGNNIRGHQGCNLEELRSMSHLSMLTLSELQNAVVTQKGSLVLQNKSHLKVLGLSCTTSTSTDGTTVECTEEEIHEIQATFAELAPPGCLEELAIESYFGHQFPCWMMQSSLGSFLPQLRVISLSNCVFVEQLPPLGQLPELRHLSIFDASSVVTMGLEFLGRGSRSASFPKLEFLDIHGMPNLQGWSFCGEREEMAVLPHLRCLWVADCPKLESLPRGLKRCPKLWIHNVGLKEIDNLNYLTEWLQIKSCRNLERISNLPALRKLDIDDESVSTLKCVEKMDSLESLTIYNLEMQYLPKVLLALLQDGQQHQQNNLQLYLYCDTRLMSRCSMEGEYWSIIRNIPRVTVFDRSRLKYLYYTKEPFDYDTNICWDSINL